MKKYELILIDADDTLFDYPKGEETAFEESCNSFGINYDKEFHLGLYKKINSKIWLEFEEKKISADELKTERFRRFFAELGLKISAQEFSDCYLTNLGKADYLLEGAEKLSEYLYNNYKLILVTNGLSKVQRSRISRSAISEYYKDLVISEEIGTPKPEEGIFSKCLEVAEHTDKNTTLIIGDNLGSDIKGGENFGIDTCWVNLNNKINETKINPTYEISSLSEVYQIL
ncbi:MAG: YjjG family noncanonical pyrimidine nucleotidase [Rhodothermaceae bacterium]